jgi:predicted membrane GTPase involved in stress response
MLTYLEEIMEGRDPRGTLRKKQHASVMDALEQVTDDRVLKVVCLLSEASLQISKAEVSDQVLCMKLLQNIIVNIDQFTEPPVAAMFERDLYEYQEH